MTEHHHTSTWYSGTNKILYTRTQFSRVTTCHMTFLNFRFFFFFFMHSLSLVYVYFELQERQSALSCTGCRTDLLCRTVLEEQTFIFLKFKFCQVCTYFKKTSLMKGRKEEILQNLVRCTEQCRQLFYFFPEKILLPIGLLLSTYNVLDSTSTSFHTQSRF